MKMKKDFFIIKAVGFPVLSLLALLFVFWIGVSSFQGNSHEIFRQLYRTIAIQSVTDIEAAVRTGKTIEGFYGIDSLLHGTIGYIGENAQAAVTDASGRVIHSTFDMESVYTRLMREDNVQVSMEQGAHSREGAIVTADDYEILIQPIFGRDASQSGNLCIIYPAWNPELFAEQSDRMLVMTLIVAVCIMAAVFIWLFIQRRVGAALNGRLFAAVPALLLAVGILIQGAVSFFTYQAHYREMMLRSARITSLYMESLVSQVREKGVPYDRMHGLDVFFAEKLDYMPGLWDMKLVRVLADSQEVLARDNDYQISVPISEEGEQTNMRLDVTISRAYIVERMNETLLLSFIMLIICVVAVVEIMKLPEIIALRLSGDFAQPSHKQWEGTRSGLRLFSFLMYTAVYIVIPFSSMLVRQWRQTMFGLPLDVTAGIPMTVEILALMLGGLLCVVVFKRLNVKIGLSSFAALFIAANLACLLVDRPLPLAVLRFLSGIGFSGAMFTANYVISHYPRLEGVRSSALAGINAGLLGGIMVGGALGAVIASTMGILYCFIAAAGLCAVAGVVLLTIMPWKMLIEKHKESRRDVAAGIGRISVRSLLNPRVIAFFLLVMVPLSFGLMFIVAGMPVFAQAKGLSPLLLSCGFLANGIAGIYLGGPLLNMFTRKMTGSALVAATLILGGFAVGALFLPPTWLMLLLCAFLLGIFDGVGTPTVMLVFLELPGIKDMRMVDALAVESTIIRAVNILAPLAYGLIIASTANSEGAFAALGGAFIAAGLLYLIVGKTRQKVSLN